MQQRSNARTAHERRRFYLDRALRRRPVGTGSAHAHLLALPWKPLPVKPAAILVDIPFVIVGGVATRMYMPERATKDIDILVTPVGYAGASTALEAAGYRRYDHPLLFPNAGLGLRGHAWTSNLGEVDLLTSDQAWCVEAVERPQRDREGNPTVALAYLILMKLDAARLIDQGDIGQMLGVLNDSELENIVATIAKHVDDPTLLDDLRQYAEVGRLELQDRPS